MRAKLLALIAGSAIALTAAVPANATVEVYDDNLVNDYFGNYHVGCAWTDLDEDDNIDDISAPNTDPTDELILDNCAYVFVYDGALDINHYNRYVGGSTESDGVWLDAPFCSSGWGIDLTDPSTTVEVDEHGDQVYVVTGTYNGLDVRGELRIYAEGDVLRWHWTFDNSTNADINGTDVEVDNGDSQDNYGDGTTSDGDQVWETGDWYATMFDHTYNDETERSGIATAFVGGNGEIEIDQVEEDDVVTNGSELYLHYNFDVPAGGTKELVYFLSNSDYTEDTFTDESVDPLVADFEGGVLQGRYARGLVDNDDSNWDVIIPEPAAEEDLAETGIDASGIALGGALVLAAGAAVVIRRRVRA